MQKRRKKGAGVQGSILWVDGKRASDSSFVPDLRQKGLTIETVSTGKAALTQLESFSPHIIVVDAASLRTSGLRICRTIHSAVDGLLPVILIANPDRPVAKDASMRCMLNHPFTVRKIYNRISALLPSDGRNLLIRGPITLDTKRRIVTSGGRETKLTPRLAHLLHMLMKKPGAVIKRARLFQVIWKTDYIGDTRTLDVHISWLRKAIEPNPRQPRYLRTVRGVGYRLDL